jgi:hypothetical protein
MVKIHLILIELYLTKNEILTFCDTDIEKCNKDLGKNATNILALNAVKISIFT